MSPNQELTLGDWRWTDVGRDSDRLQPRSSVGWRPVAGTCIRTSGDVLTESSLPQKHKQRQADSRLHCHGIQTGSLFQAAIFIGKPGIKRWLTGSERSRTPKTDVLASCLARPKACLDDVFRSLFESLLIVNLWAKGLQETRQSNQTSDGFHLGLTQSTYSSGLSVSSTRLTQQIVRGKNVSI